MAVLQTFVQLVTAVKLQESCTAPLTEVDYSINVSGLCGFSAFMVLLNTWPWRRRRRCWKSQSRETFHAFFCFFQTLKDASLLRKYSVLCTFMVSVNRPVQLVILSCNPGTLHTKPGKHPIPSLCHRFEQEMGVTSLSSVPSPSITSWSQAMNH